MASPPQPALSTSSYIQASEMEAYGLGDAKPWQVAQASRIVDALTLRPRSGFVWVPGADGTPCYMAAATADRTETATGPIATGTNVVVQVSSYPFNPEIIGEVCVIDRGTPAATEACVVTAVNTETPGNLTLGTVNYAHVGTPSLEFGLVPFEERFMPADRSLSRLSQWPIVRIYSALGRYSYGRRSQQVQGNFSEFNLLAILQNFGGPPVFVPLDVTQLGLNRTTGEVWVPAGVLLAYYSDFRCWYLSGWSQRSLPLQIKQATANIVHNAVQAEGVSSMFKVMKAGDSELQRFADEAVDGATKEMLRHFRANSYV